MKRSMNFKEVSVHATPDQSPGFLLWHVSTSWRGSIEQVLKPIGLTHPQFVILATLAWLTREGERVSQAVIGKMSGLDPNTVSQIIRGLEQKELILRTPSSDARAKNPMLTEKGSDLLRIALPVVESTDALFFKSLTVKEREQMLRLFKKLIPNGT